MFSSKHNFRWIFLTLSLCIGCDRKETAPFSEQAIVFTQEIKPSKIFETLQYPARVHASTHATILAESAGRIVHIRVNLGEPIKSHQTLMILQHTDPIYHYAPFQVLSPIAGVISSIDVTKGSHVKEGQPLATVMNPSDMSLQTEIPAQDLPVLKMKLQGVFRCSDTPEIQYPVEVSGISPFVKPHTSTASAKLRILKPHPTLAPGMQGYVIFEVNTHLGILVPETALFHKSKQTWVKIVEHQQVYARPVKLGKKYGHSLEILEGLSPGNLLVERSSRAIAEGEFVQTLPAQTPGSLPSTQPL